MKKIFSVMLLAASFVCLTACSGDDEEVRPNIPAGRDMKVGETYNLGYKAQWESSNEYAATVNNDGVVTAVRKGIAKIYSSQENLWCIVSVTPSYTLYNEPIMQWGISKNSLKSQKGTPDQVTSTVLSYETGNTIAPLEMYLFENDRLSSASIVVKLAYAEEMVEHLVQRYVPVEIDLEDYNVYLVDPAPSGERKVYVLVQAYNKSYCLVAYMNVSDSTTRSDSDRTELLERMMKEFSTIDIMEE